MLLEVILAGMRTTPIASFFIPGFHYCRGIGTNSLAPEPAEMMEPDQPAMKRRCKSEKPVRDPVERQDFIGLKARADDGEAVTFHQHFGYQRAGVVGAGLHRTIGASRIDREQISPLQRG